MENTFFTAVISQVPRLLGQLNRNIGSATYGSFDRAFWHYRTNDISSCRYQEAIYTLALLYTSQFEKNVYYHNAQILSWIRASLAFTVTLQHDDGSFDEWYIHEGSYVGTAFLTAALAQTLIVLENHDVNIPERAATTAALERAAKFLVTYQEGVVMNQVSGALFAIAAVGKILNNEDFTHHADRLLTIFLSKQSEEGWWSEYGGPDIGYLSLTISYLNKYQALMSSDKLSVPIAKAKNFIEAFINPDFTAGGEHMSRNTEYLIPSPSLPYLGALHPEHLDDRYLCYILYNWIEAGLVTVPRSMERLDYIKYFPESGLLRVSEQGLFVVANGRKGGSFRIYIENGVYFDSGLEITRTDEVLSTGILDSLNQVTYIENLFQASGYAKTIKEPLLTTKIMIPFKTWQLLFGRFPIIQKMIKKFLRERMISYGGVGIIPYERTIECDETQVVVTDTVRAGVSQNDIVFGVKASYTAVPSSKYIVSGMSALQTITPQIIIHESDDAVMIRRVFNRRSDYIRK